jgi:hypothetical protein
MLALAKHSIRFCELLEERGKREKINDHHLKVFRGSITKLWNEVGASNAYYSQVKRSLEDMSCIVILQRGSVNVDSVVAVLRTPSPDEFAPQDLTKAEQPASLRQELESVKRNIGGINIPDALQEIVERLEILEREVIQSNGKAQGKSKSEANI